MKLSVNCFTELKKIKDINMKKFIIDLQECPNNEMVKVIDFLCGLTFMTGSLKKININEFEVTI